jgi:PhnB protein
MKIVPYLILDGKAEAAFQLYEKALNGKIVMLSRFGETPGAANTDADQQRIMHVRLEAGDNVLMGSDTTTDRPHEGNHGMYVSLQVDSIADAERIFAALSEGGQVIMPLAPTFWATRFAMLVDRFGVSWMVNLESA